jgi:hypothetical protein
MLMMMINQAGDTKRIVYKDSLRDWHNQHNVASGQCQSAFPLVALFNLLFLPYSYLSRMYSNSLSSFHL